MPISLTSTEFTFHHDLVRNSLLQGVPPSEQAELHLAVLNLLEQEPGRHADEARYFHLKEAVRLNPACGAHVRLCELGLARGLVALRSNLPGHAVEVLSELLSLAGPGAQRLEIGYRLGQALTAMGRLANARECFEEALLCGGEPGTVAAARGCLGWVLHLLGESEAGGRLIRKAWKAHVENGDLAGEAASIADLGAIALSVGDHDKAFELTQSALRKYRDLGNLQGVLKQLTNLSVFHRRQGHLDEASECFNEIDQLANVDNDPVSRVRNHINRGNARLDADQFDGAIEDYLRAEDIAGQLGEHQLMYLALLNHAGALVSKGDSQGAERLLRRARERALEVGDRRLLAYVIEKQAGIAIGFQDYRLATSLLKEQEGIAEALSDTSQLANIRACRGIIASRGGDHESAVRNHLQAVELSRACEGPTELIGRIVNLVESYCDASEFAAAQVLVLEALELCDKAGCSNTVQGFRCVAAAVRVEAGCHHDDDAQFLARDALELGDRLNIAQHPDAHTRAALDRVREYRVRTATTAQ